MAIRLIDRYPNRTGIASANYPHGSFQNKSDPTADDGTPLEQDWANDNEAFFQGLLERAGITPSGTVDTAQTSDYIDALRGSLIADSLTDLQAFPTQYASDGYIMQAAGRSSLGDGGEGHFRWDSSDLSTEVGNDEVTAGEGDGGIYVAPDSDKTGASGAWVRQLNSTVHPEWWGAVGDGSNDDTAGVQKALDAASGLTVKTSSVFYAQGLEVTVDDVTIEGPGSLLLNATGSLLTVQANRFSAYDISFDGNSNDYDGSLVDVSDNSERPEFYRCRFENVHGGDEASSTYRNQIYGLTLSATGVHNFIVDRCVFSNISNLVRDQVGQFSGGFFVNHTGAAPAASDQSGGVVRDCKFVSIYSRFDSSVSANDKSSYVDADAIRVYSDGAYLDSLNIQYLNNYFEKIDERAFKIGTSGTWVIDGVFIDGSETPNDPDIAAMSEAVRARGNGSISNVHAYFGSRPAVRTIYSPDIREPGISVNNVSVDNTEHAIFIVPDSDPGLIRVEGVSVETEGGLIIDSDQGGKVEIIDCHCIYDRSREGNNNNAYGFRVSSNRVVVSNCGIQNGDCDISASWVHMNGFVFDWNVDGSIFLSDNHILFDVSASNFGHVSNVDVDIDDAHGNHFTTQLNGIARLSGGSSAGNFSASDIRVKSRNNPALWLTSGGGYFDCDNVSIETDHEFIVGELDRDVDWVSVRGLTMVRADSRVMLVRNIGDAIFQDTYKHELASRPLFTENNLSLTYGVADRVYWRDNGNAVTNITGFNTNNINGM